MISLNMTAGNDNLVRWIVKITTDSNTYLFANKDITLSSNDYDGSAMTYQSLGVISSGVDITNGGGVGYIGGFNFGISRFQSNALIDGFFNEFYPATSADNLTGRKVDVGIVWSNATTEAEITWLYQYYIDDYGYDYNVINIVCLDKQSIDSINIPFYDIQKDYDNGISYYENAEPETYGSTIPIVYGNFSTVDFNISDVSLAPAISVDKNRFQAKIASHKCHTICLNNYSHDGSARNYLFKRVGIYYMPIYTANASYNNNYGGHDITLINTSTLVYGYAQLQLKILGSQSDLDDVANATDRDIDTYDTLPGDATPKKIALRIGDSLSTADMGILSQSANDIRIIPGLASNNAGDRDFTVYTYNNENATTGTGQSSTVISGTTVTEYVMPGFANDTTGKSNSNLPYTIEELCNYEIMIRNDETSTGDDIRVGNAYLELNNILVSGYIRVDYTFRVNIHGFH